MKIFNKIHSIINGSPDKSTPELRIDEPFYLSEFDNEDDEECRKFWTPEGEGSYYKEFGQQTIFINVVDDLQ